MTAPAPQSSMEIARGIVQKWLDSGPHKYQPLRGAAVTEEGR